MISHEPLYSKTLQELVIPGYVPSHSDQTPQEREEELEADALRYLTEARKRDAINRYEQFCPNQYRDFDINNPVVQNNLRAVKTVLGWKYGRMGLLCAGPTGESKTRTVWALYRRLAYEDGIEVKHFHASDWLSALHDCVKYGRDEASGWIKDLAWRHVVIIDDWGQEANLKAREEWAQAWFFRFLDLRIERGLPLIMTTNLTAKDIVSRSDNIRSDPLLRRMLETMNIVKFGS